jgi:hypothetical protein
MHETAFKGQAFRFLTIPTHRGTVFVPQSDVLNAFCAAMPKMPKEFNEVMLAECIRGTIEAGERQRAVIEGVIEPVISTDAIMTMCQGMNGAIRERKEIKKAAKGFDDFCTFFADNLGPALDAFGAPDIFDRMGIQKHFI